MLDYMVDFFVSWFVFPGILWTQVLLGVGLSVAFGAIWFISYWTSILKKPSAWAVLITSALLTLAAISFIQIPLQVWTGQALSYFWSQEVLMRWLLLAGIPQIFLSGLVQEGSKLVPIVVYWWRSDKYLEPKLGLAIGAVAGLGFGVFESAWALNQVFAAGWTWDAVQSGGVVALAAFWERLFAVGAHIAFAALAGYGLATRRGWQFYLLAAFLHGLLNYSVVLLQLGVFTGIQLEIYAAVLAVVVTAGALWLRWRNSEV